MYYNHSLFDRASFYYASCSSTNDIAKKYLLNSRVAEGTIFITDYQSQGRGQRGNSWAANANENLLFSFVLYPEWLAVGHSFALNIITSLAIYDMLMHQFSEGIYIKWPNDIYYLDKKLGGILIETSMGSRQKIKEVVVGVGLNVNQLIFESPNATSLALYKGTVLDRSALLTNFTNALSSYYEKLHSSMIDLLWEIYLSKLYQKTGFHLFETMHRCFKGRIVTVNKLGQLVVEEDNGNHYSYNAKEIMFISKSLQRH